MADIPEKEYSLLIKFCGMLSSDNENERAIAAQRATMILRKYKTTWEEVVLGKVRKLTVTTTTYTAKPQPSYTQAAQAHQNLFNTRATFQYRVHDVWVFVWSLDVRKILTTPAYRSKLILQDDLDFLEYCNSINSPLTKREEKMILGIIDYLKHAAGYVPICQ